MTEEQKEVQEVEIVETPEVEERVERVEQEEQTPEAAPEVAPEPETLVVQIGDDQVEEEERAPEWVRDLRKKNREDQRRIRELESKLAEKEAPKQALGKKPDLEEFDYDTEKYEAALASWFERKRVYDAQQEVARQREEEVNRSWQQKLMDYADGRKKLKVKDYEDVEEVVSETFDVTQQGVIISGAENPALVVYALGKNPKKLKELSGISDPVKFAFAIAKLETQLKVNKKSPPPPEKVVGGTAPIRGAVDSNLERLRADAEKSGDYSKVFAYKKQKRA